MAIIDEGHGFGGGNLASYGINSNTSAKGFLKCTYRQKKNDESKNDPNSATPAMKDRSKSLITTNLKAKQVGTFGKSGLNTNPIVK